MDDVVETSLVEKGIHYRIKLSIHQADCFSIMLIDEDQPERWEGIFPGQTISKLTASAGSMKKVSIFWKMLQNAVLKNSQEVSYRILTQQEINDLTSNSLSSSKVSQSRSEMSDPRYFILVQINEYDHTQFPLKLVKKPYSTDELKAIIRNLRSENNRLSKSEQSNNQKETVQALEQQIYALNGSMKKLADEKDQVIMALRRQITDLEEQARTRKAQKVVKKSFRSNPPDSNKAARNRSRISNLSNSRTTPTSTRRKATNASNSRITSSHLYNSRFSSASSSAGGSRRSSASNSRNSSAVNSRRSSAIGSARSSASNSRRNSANNSRPSSRNSSSSFKRFNPTEWVRNHQSGNSSRNNSRNNSRNQSPMNLPRSAKRNSRVGVTSTDKHLDRLHALIQNKYKKF